VAEDNPGQATHRTKIDLLVAHHLVLAKAIRASKHRGRVESEWKIVRVYKGPSGLKGKTFAADGNLFGGGLGMLMFRHVPERGELGVWAVVGGCKEGGRQAQCFCPPPALPTPPTQRLGFVGLPARSDDLPERFPEIQAWAQAVETVLASERPEDLLKTYAACSVVEISGWAVEVLDKNWPGEESTEFFRKLLEEDRPPTASVAAQTYVDRALGRRLGDAWFASPRRVAIMERWVGAGLSDYTLTQLLSRLHESTARGRSTRKRC
jgi:hypothetical protein